GVATKEDTLPNIVKAGMVLTDAGLAFGDADTLSKWRNPTKNAWDDFDWIRYACQSADNEDEAVRLLTTEAVDQLHATGVSENLFLIGPQKSFVIEADAIHSTTTEVSDVTVMSNYPKALWQTQLIRSLPIARSYDAQKETMVRKGSIVHLGSVCGVKILSVTSSSITAQVFPVFVFKNANQTKEVTLSRGERATVGPYSVTVRELNENTARISVCTVDYAWEQTMQNQIQPQIGNITILDMIRWSRLHTMDLENLRPMCEDQNTYEAAMVFKIPTEHATLLSSGWFAANHACSSIFIPVHICDTDFYNPYETGDAAALSLALLQKFGHDNITGLCQSVENVFYVENEINEVLAHLMIHAELNITSFLTEADSGMQEQAYLMQQLWLSLPNLSKGGIQDLWEENYMVTKQNIKENIAGLTQNPESYPVIALLEKIMQSISESMIKKQTIESLFFIKTFDVYYNE
ncbi:MAG: hypothetical protein MUC80_01020, partial [Candidatus Thermoplasmatota archaeon]|nr:hypothetical protein [Candidatus Thermoplasmatota archaeon]